LRAHRSNSALAVQVVGVLAALGVAIGLLLAEGVIYNTPSEMPTPTQIQEEERALLLWLDRAREQRQQESETSGGASAWSLLEQYAQLGVMPSNGRRNFRSPIQE